MEAICLMKKIFSELTLHLEDTQGMPKIEVIRGKYLLRLVYHTDNADHQLSTRHSLFKPILAWYSLLYWKIHETRDSLKVVKYHAFHFSDNSF
jgi:hypothetical protein